MTSKFFKKFISSLLIGAVLVTSADLPAFAASANLDDEYSIESEEYNGLPAIERTVGSDNVLVAIEGTAFKPIADATLTKINELRREACENGYINPDTGKALSKDDYKQMFWSNDMTSIALLRAAEASVYRSEDGKRPNGKANLTPETEGGIKANSEIIDWKISDNPFADILADAEKQKSDWITSKNYAKADLYCQLINPVNVALGAVSYKTSEQKDNNKTVAFEFGTNKASKDATPTFADGNINVKVELPAKNVTGLYFTKTTLTIRVSEKTEVYTNAYVSMKATNNGTTYESSAKGRVYEGISWESTDENIARVFQDKNDNKWYVYGQSAGQDVKITATVKKNTKIQKNFLMEVKKGDFSSLITVKGFKKSLPYNFGEPVYQKDVQVYLPNPEDKKNPTLLVYGVDYEIRYENYQDVSTDTKKAKMIISPINGNFKNDKVMKYKITPFDISKADANLEIKMSVSGNTNAVYVKGGAQPALSVSYNGRQLIEGTDFKVKYSTNKKFTTSKLSATVKGKKNYKGSKKFYFYVDKADLGRCTVECKDVVYKESKKWKKYISKGKIYDINGKKLKANTDYIKSLTYTVSENGVEKTVTKNTSFYPGMTISVNATGKGWYENKVVGSYRLVEKSIAKAKVKLTTSRFSEDITVNDIDVILKGETLNSTDYEIVSAKLNKSGSKLTVVVHGLGRYGCTKKVTFKY